MIQLSTKLVRPFIGRESGDADKLPGLVLCLNDKAGTRNKPNRRKVTSSSTRPTGLAVYAGTRLSMVQGHTCSTNRDLLGDCILPQSILSLQGRPCGSSALNIASEPLDLGSSVRTPLYKRFGPPLSAPYQRGQLSGGEVASGFRRFFKSRLSNSVGGCCILVRDVCVAVFLPGTLAVMNGIRCLPTSLVCSLTDIFILISVLLWFSLDLYYTSYPCLPPWICLTRLTSLRHLLARRFSKAKVEVASTRRLLSAQRSELRTQCSVLTSQPSTVQRHSRSTVQRGA
jgi:hypothetical protein